jgi:hypothetical protein
MDPSNVVKIVLGGHKCHNQTRKRVLYNYKEAALQEGIRENLSVTATKEQCQ